MKFLLCGVFTYYGQDGTHDPMYYYFTDPLKQLNIEYEIIDTYKYGYNEAGREAFNVSVFSKVKKTKYEAMIVATYGYEFLPEILDEIRKYTTLIAWNSDDDWRWDNYSKNYAVHYDLMYTTYKDIYDQNSKNYPGLRFSQWACLQRYDGFNKKKNIPFSFVGAAYGDRLKILYDLKKKINIQFWGKNTYHPSGSYYLDAGIRKMHRGFKKYFHRSIFPDDYLNFDQVNEIWSSTKISLNLMKASKSDKIQIKSRTFDMGLSGTVMICEHAPNMELYYEPEKEFITFSEYDEVPEKVNYYLAHENELINIAKNYYLRTKKEHLWKHRMQQILHDAKALGKNLISFLISCQQ